MSPLRRNIRQSYHVYERTLGPARLYLDDVSDIVESLRQAAEEFATARIKRMRSRVRDLEAQAAKDKNPTVEQRATLGGARAALEAAEAELKQPDKVKIKAGEAIADEADDLRSASPEDLRNIIVSSYRPDIAVWLGHRGARAFSFSGVEETQVRLWIDDVATFVNERSTRVIRPSRTAITLVLLLALTSPGASRTGSDSIS